MSMISTWPGTSLESLLWLILAIVASLMCFISLISSKKKKIKPYLAFLRSFYFMFLPLVIISLMIYFDVIRSDWFGRGKLKGTFLLVGIEFFLLGIFFWWKLLFHFWLKKSSKEN